MLSLKARSRRTESARASDSRALTSPPGGNAILPGIRFCCHLLRLSGTSLLSCFCRKEFQSVTPETTVGHKTQENIEQFVKSLGKKPTVVIKAKIFFY